MSNVQRNIGNLQLLSPISSDTRLHDFYVEVYEYDPAQYPSQPARVCLDYEGVVLAGTPVTLPCTTVFTGRYVKLRRKFKNPGDDRFTICELEVYGPDSCLKSTYVARFMHNKYCRCHTNREKEEFCHIVHTFCSLYIKVEQVGLFTLHPWFF